MIYTCRYDSPIGGLLLAASDEGLKGVWMDGQKYYLASLPKGSGEPVERPDHPVLIAARAWLDRYFAGKAPSPEELPLAPEGSAFRQRVWRKLCEIPYGETVTYGRIAKELAEESGKESMSSQAVGGAVGHNPISIIIPCHRVVGADGSLTGYAGGIGKKVRLLTLEGADMSRFYVPSRGTAL